MGGAMAVHLVVAGAGYLVARAPEGLATTEAPVASEMDVELDTSFVAATVRESVEPEEIAGFLPSHRSSDGAGEAEVSRVSPDANEPPNTGPEGGYALDPTAPALEAGQGQRVELGIGPGDWSKWVDPSRPLEAPASPRVEHRAAPASTTGGVAEALEAHDQQIGLGPAGPVLSAAHQAGHSEAAPAIGTANFTVTVLRTGMVQVDLVSASSNVAAWHKVAESLADAVKRRPPRIDGGRNGVRLGIELKAEERWPNGSVARSEGPSLAVTGVKIQATEKAIEDLSKRNPVAVAPPGAPSEQPPLQLNVEPPGVWLKGRGRVCGYQVGLSMLGPMLTGGCDPSNIGAPPQRIVSVKITEQTML